jgi:GT2 family glycosyltransferase|tara:strand:- start:3304 stop:4257 length:954 start_codon:yes stop_codon:yes gene_type:complete
MKNMPRFAAATVTYGDRSIYLYQNVDKLLNEGFCNIYVLFNGVNAKLVMDAKKRYEDKKVVFIVSKKNTGSAGGYYRLLKYILKYDDCDRVLLLDDDNLVPDKFLEKATKICKLSKDIYYFNRPDRALPFKAYLEKKPKKIFGDDSNFLGRTIFKIRNIDEKNYTGDLLAAPYGGLLLPRSALEVNVFPDTDFFLYADDYDYTFRLCTDAKFNITLVNEPEIKDLEKSYHLKGRSRSLLRNRYHYASGQQLFFSVRNQIFLSLRESSFLPLFFANVILFSMIYLLQFFLNFQLKKAFIFLKAVFKGLLWGLRLRFRG